MKIWAVGKFGGGRSGIKILITYIYINVARYLPNSECPIKS